MVFTNVHQLIELQAQEAPEKPALLLVNGRQITFGTLNQRANRLAHYLIAQGLQKGQVVGLHMPRNPGLNVGALAILKAGGVYVVIPPDFPEKRKEFIVQQTAMPFLVTNPNAVNQVPEHDATVITIGTSFSEELRSYPTANPALDIRPNDPAFLVYTSGSTGEPKGILRSHRAELRRYYSAQKRFPFQADDVYIGTAAINSIAFGRQLAVVLGSGIPLLIMPDVHFRDPHKFIEHLIYFGITELHITPVMLRTILALQKHALENVTHLRKCFVAGDTLTPDLVRDFYEKLPTTTLINVYGSSEVSVGTKYIIPHDFVPDESGRVPLGKPFPDAPVYILDDELNLLPDGEVGEICLGSDSQAVGYYKNPQATQEKFIPNPFVEDSGACIYRTGDLGYFNPDGNLMIVGRKDSQIKIRGYRIHLAEIERTLSKHPQVEQAVVVAKKRSADEHNPYLVAYVQTKQPTSALVLKNYLDAYLPEHMVPVHYRQIDAFPLVSTGKIDRQLLTESDVGTSLLFSSRASFSQDRIEYQVMGIWRDLLENDGITSHTHFLDAGGDSLVAVEMMLLLEETFDIEVPMRVLAGNPTVHELAIWIKLNTKQSAPSPLVRLQEGTAEKTGVFILVPPAGSTALSHGAMMRAMPAQHPIYGIHPRGFDEGEEPHNQVEAMARFYLPPLLELQRHDLILCGHCFGATVALELAQQYEAATGIRLPLIVIDNPPPASGPTWKAPWMQDPDHARDYEYHLSKLLNERDITEREHRQHPTWLPHRFAGRTYIAKPYSGRVLILHSAQIHENMQKRSLRHREDPFWQWHDLFQEPQIETLADAQHFDILATDDQRQRIRTIIAKFITLGTLA